jgi:hypothetical protein
MYTWEETNAGVGSGRRNRLLDMWISLLHIGVKRVRNNTARFRCVFGSTDGYGVWKKWVDKICLVSILFFTLHIPLTNAQLPAYCLRSPSYDTFYGEHKSDAGVDFRLIWISLLQTLSNVFIIERRDYVVSSVVQTDMEFERIGWV